jgi:hypothetical protein
LQHCHCCSSNPTTGARQAIEQLSRANERG